jgi:hypothetical protein
MSVSGINSSSNTFQTWAQIKAQQLQMKFNQLGTALQAGDLASAQSAFQSLQAVAPQAAGTDANGNQAAANGSNTIKADSDAVGAALQASDLTAAQTAFTKLQSDLQAMRGTHRGHHHHHRAGGTQNDTTSAAAAGSANQADTFVRSVTIAPGSPANPAAATDGV